MLISCTACAAVNVIDSDRAATGEARCMICRKTITFDRESEPRQSFRARAASSASIALDIEDALRHRALVMPEASFIEDEEEEDLDIAPLWGHRTPVQSPPQAAPPRVMRRASEAWIMAAFLVVIGIGSTCFVFLSTSERRNDHAAPPGDRPALALARDVVAPAKAPPRPAR